MKPKIDKQFAAAVYNMVCQSVQVKNLQKQFEMAVWCSQSHHRRWRAMMRSLQGQDIKRLLAKFWSTECGWTNVHRETLHTCAQTEWSFIFALPLIYFYFEDFLFPLFLALEFAFFLSQIMSYYRLQLFPFQTSQPLGTVPEWFFPPHNCKEAIWHLEASTIFFVCFVDRMRTFQTKLFLYI